MLDKVTQGLGRNGVRAATNAAQALAQMCSHGCRVSVSTLLVQALHCQKELGGRPHVRYAALQAVTQGFIHHIQ